MSTEHRQAWVRRRRQNRREGQEASPRYEMRQQYLNTRTDREQKTEQKNTRHGSRDDAQGLQGGGREDRHAGQMQSTGDAHARRIHCVGVRKVWHRSHDQCRQCRIDSEIQIQSTSTDINCNSEDRRRIDMHKLAGK